MFHFLDNRSKTACRATPASAAGGGYSEQGLAPRSKRRKRERASSRFGHRKRAVWRPSAPAIGNPRNPSNCKGFVDFLFSPNVTERPEMPLKFTAKVVQNQYKLGEIVGKTQKTVPKRVQYTIFTNSVRRFYAQENPQILYKTQDLRVVFSDVG